MQGQPGPGAKTVKDEAGNWHNARMKGVFKIDNITSTNPVAVGDEVEVDVEDEAENTAIITEIHARRNYINRQSPRVKHQHHIVASNLDQSMLVATLIVTWRSCIASSKADCTLAGALFISSARIKLANMGPLRTTNSFFCWL